MAYNDKFVTLTTEELEETNAGGAGLVALGVAGCLCVFGLGIYNGYNDTKDQKK